MVESCLKMSDIENNKLNSIKRKPRKIEVRYVESENNGAIEVFVNMVKADLLKPISEKEAQATLGQHQNSPYNKIRGAICQK